MNGELVNGEMVNWRIGELAFHFADRRIINLSGSQRLDDAHFTTARVDTSRGQYLMGPILIASVFWYAYLADKSTFVQRFGRSAACQNSVSEFLECRTQGLGPIIYE